MSKSIEVNLFAKEENQEDSSIWVIDVSINGQVKKSIKPFQEPFNGAHEEEYRWYIEDFARKWPFETKKAAAVVTDLKTYANRLCSELGLEKLIEAALSTSPDEHRDITINITEDIEMQNSIHRLHWELLEDSTLWNTRTDATVKRLIKIENNSVSAVNQDLELREHQVSEKQRVNGLLVVARDLSEEQKSVDIDPNLTLGILAKFKQDLSSQSCQTYLNLEVVRPGTIDALEEHLEQATAKHGKGHYHFVHLDVHGIVEEVWKIEEKVQKKAEKKAGKTVWKNKGKRTERKVVKSAYLLFNDPDPTDYKRTEKAAQAVATILARHGVGAVVLNACESAKANSGDAANLAKLLTGFGVQNVLAMSFMINASAAEIFLRGFYHSLLLQGQTFSQAAREARKLLRERKDRKARLGLKRPVNDGFVPVVYSLGQDLKLVPQTRQSIESSLGFSEFSLGSAQPANADMTYLTGRDFDLLRLEKRLLAHKRVHLTGRAGVGKTALIRYASHIWLQTSFADLILFVDFSKVKALSDAIDSFVSHMPVDQTQRTMLSSELGRIFRSENPDQGSFSNLVFNACPHPRLIIIIDGLQFDKQWDKDPMPNATSKVALLATGRFIEAILKLVGDQVSIHHVVVSRLDASTLPISEEVQQKLGMDHMRLAELQLEESVELGQSSLRKAGLNVDEWKDIHEREHKLIVGLLDGNPSAILQIVPQMVQSGTSLGKFRGLIQHGIPPGKAYAGPGKDQFEEIDMLFRDLNDEERAIILLLSVFWNEAIGLNYFTDWIFSQRICKNQMNSLVVPYFQRRGLIDYELQVEKHGAKKVTDAIITWIHPLLTVYGRRTAYEILSKKQGTPGKSQIMAATLVCSIMGAKFKEYTVSQRQRVLRQNFTSWFLKSVEDTHFRRAFVAKLEGLTFQKLKSFWSVEVGNLAVCLALCCREPYLPMDQWPLEYFQDQIPQIRLVGLPAEVEYFAERFEVLLEVALLNRVPEMQRKHQIFILMTIVCLAAIYTSEWPDHEKREKYVKLAPRILDESEKGISGPFEEGSQAMYLKGLVYRQELTYHLSRGAFHEAVDAGEKSLKIDQSFISLAEAQKNGQITKTSSLGTGWDETQIKELTKQLSTDENSKAIEARLEAISGNTTLKAYMESRKRVLDLLRLFIDEENNGKDPDKSRKIGGILRGLGKVALPDINTAANAMGLQNMNIDSGWFPEGDDLRKFLQVRDSPEGRLTALENAMGLGNTPRTTQQFVQTMTSSFKNLDIDAMGEYLDGLIELSHKNTLPGAMGSVDWDVQKGMLGNLTDSVNILTRTPKSTEEKRSGYDALAESVRKEIIFLKQNKAPEEAIQAAETRLESWLKYPNAMEANDSPEDASTRREIMQKTAEIGLKMSRNEKSREQLFKDNLEFEKLKKKLLAQEQKKDYTGYLETLAVLETFCKGKGREMYAMTCPDTWFREQRAQYEFLKAAKPVTERFIEVLSRRDYDGARDLIKAFEAGLTDKSVRESEQAKKTIPGLLATIESTRAAFG